MTNFMYKFLIINFLCLFWTQFGWAQKSGTESKIIKIDRIETADTSRAVVKVVVMESGSTTPVQGATVLLRRDTDKMHGRVTQEDGRCHFRVAPGQYVLRAQMTGLISLEHAGIIFEKGKSYTIALEMANQ